MSQETIEELTATIRELTDSTKAQCDLMETLNARQADLISEIKILRNVIEQSPLKN